MLEIRLDNFTLRTLRMQLSAFRFRGLIMRVFKAANRRFTPVNTGRLRASFQILIRRSGVVLLRWHVPYAQYVRPKRSRHSGRPLFYNAVVADGMLMLAQYGS